MLWLWNKLENILLKNCTLVNFWPISLVLIYGAFKRITALIIMISWMFHYIDYFQHTNQVLGLITPLKLLSSLSLLSDIYWAIDKSKLSLLALFDVSAAFDMVDHQLLLECLETSCGIKGLPHLWLTSYLSVRTHTVISSDSRTPWVPVLLGIPMVLS